MGPGDPSRAHQREVAGHDVDAAIGEGCQGGPGPASIPAHQRRLDQAAPEDLFGRTNQQGQSSGDLGLRPERPQGVDVADLGVAARHELSRETISNPERQVERAG